MIGLSEDAKNQVDEAVSTTKWLRELAAGTLIEEPSGVKLFKTKHNGWISQDFVRRSSVNIQRPVQVLHEVN